MLLCTGPKFGENELALMRKCGMGGRIAYAHPTNDAQMAGLYKSAKLFVYTSEYEGFGIPTLEAYKMKCPVLLNGNNPCFHEVAGDAAVFYDNESQEDTCEKVEYILDMNEDEMENLIHKQSNRLSLYSWEKTGRIVANIYKDIYGKQS